MNTVERNELLNENEIAGYVRRALGEYFKDLEGEEPAYSIYDLVMNCVEKPLIETIMQHAEGNQTRAADLLGINRNTLRKKMLAHGIK